MRLLLLLAAAGAAFGATFGTVVAITGGATDLVLDEGRGRLYVVNNTQNRVDVYSTAQRRFLNPIAVGSQPLSAALARSGKYLYVTAYETGSLDVIDLDTGALFKRVSLPAAPEGVAVGGDERVLITTAGSGTNNADNRLMIYDGSSLQAVASTLPAPSAPGTTVPGRVFQSTRSNLAASQDGQWIIGLNNPNAASRQLFVYEVASGSILRSRTVASISNVLGVAPDGSRFMAGLSLFERDTLAIVAQQNTANAIHPMAANANFNTQQNQGGSVFSPDGGVVYSAFNIAPVQVPAARANTTMLMLSDPRNLLIRLTLQLPENLTGNIVSSSDGATLYGLSQSGFLIVPVSAIYDNPIAVVDNPTVMVANDQCGVTDAMRKVTVTVRNAGRGRFSASAQVLQTGPTQTQPLAGGNVNAGGGQGPGGGAQGGPVVIVLPVGPGGAGGGQVQLPGTNPNTATTTTTAQQTAITQSAPSVTTRRTDTETQFDFTFNQAAARSLGTIAPTEFLIQSAEAINVPARVRVLQNNRNAEARGNLIPVPVSISTAEGLVDIVHDAPRERLYMANSGLNRVEVFDTRENRLLDPIQVGQLPRSLALHPNGRLLYVANTGGESISVIDLEAGAVTGSVRFPPVPYNASFALITPAALAATLSGVQMVMSDGSLWKVVNNEAIPRGTSRVIGTATVTAPRGIVATPGGEYALLLAGNGNAYLFDAMTDEYVLGQTVAAAPIQGYYGTLAAGPGGRYFVVNGTLLNSSLTPVGGAASARPVAAVAAMNATTAAAFTIPATANATAAVRDTASVVMLDANTGALRGGSFPALEGPLSAQTGTTRVNVGARMMALNAAGNTAYVLTTTGLSIVPLTAAATGGTIQVSQNGVLNAASLQSGLAPGSLVTVVGQNLASASNPQTVPLPKSMGGSCVTIDEAPVPIQMSAPGQMQIQLPPDLRTGSHSLVVRSIERNVASAARTFTVAKYAPAVYVNTETGAAVYREDGSPVTNSKRAKRDERLVLYASGLGVTSGATIQAGAATPESPDAVTDAVKVYFGDVRYSQAEVIVDWSGLVPGFVGVYQLNLRIPGNHLKGEDLPVTLRMGTVSSPTTGAIVPTVDVE